MSNRTECEKIRNEMNLILKPLKDILAIPTGNLTPEIVSKHLSIVEKCNNLGKHVESIVNEYHTVEHLVLNLLEESLPMQKTDKNYINKLIAKIKEFFKSHKESRAHMDQLGSIRIKIDKYNKNTSSVEEDYRKIFDALPIIIKAKSRLNEGVGTYLKYLPTESSKECKESILREIEYYVNYLTAIRDSYLFKSPDTRIMLGEYRKRGEALSTEFKKIGGWPTPKYTPWFFWAMVVLLLCIVIYIYIGFKHLEHYKTQQRVLHWVYTIGSPICILILAYQKK